MQVQIPPRNHIFANCQMLERRPPGRRLGLSHLWKRKGPKSFVLPHELLNSAILDEDTALLRVGHQIVDPGGHVPS